MNSANAGAVVDANATTAIRTDAEIDTATRERFFTGSSSTSGIPHKIVRR